MPDNTIAQAQPKRPPQDNIPQTRQRRRWIRQIVAEYVERNKPVGPLSLEELRHCCEAIMKEHGVKPKYMDFMGVLVNNEVWRETVASIPYEKRLLLLPKCLRDNENCPAKFDEVGLLCEHCGRCPNDEFKTQAEQLGYAVLVAEGSPIVMSLVKTGQVEAIIGASCLPMLEKVFPYMEAGAIPGIAIPLLYDGCVNTSVDIDWLWEAIYHNSDEQARLIGLEQLRKEVDSWFTQGYLASLLDLGRTQTEELAVNWLTKAGKRWRPFLTAAVFQALAQNKEQQFGDELRRVAIAVECFHKASLIHDDIEDGDTLRYGQKSLHAEFGIPIALNVGDLLLGWGYSLLAAAGPGDDCRAKMLAVAAKAHCDLCLGQGRELSWMRRPGPLGSGEVIEIFRKKTAPAFGVALRLGAILAGSNDRLGEVLAKYSDALGIAYQIRDDISDFFSKDISVDIKKVKPSFLFALAYERAGGIAKKTLESVWRQSPPADTSGHEIEKIFAELKIEQAAMDLMESYKSRAMNCLSMVDNTALKSLLRRVICKIFNDIEVMGCCNDNKTPDDKSRK